MNHMLLWHDALQIWYTARTPWAEPVSHDSQGRALQGTSRYFLAQGLECLIDIKFCQIYDILCPQQPCTKFQKDWYNIASTFVCFRTRVWCLFSCQSESRLTTKKQVLCPWESMNIKIWLLSLKNPRLYVFIKNGGCVLRGYILL